MTGNSMLKRYWGLCVCLMLIGGGCVSMPPVELSPEIAPEELSDHVHFLAQPRLNGRKPLSYGSALSRRYIIQQFEALGLVPWGDAECLAQPFILGSNVVGVLPGRDPNLAEEVVILSAHYDHLGRTKQGLCLGAADNASGVAVLLEIAESLALSAIKPTRSICFAAFDQEEKGLLGAFDFACRADFDPNRIVGLVNIDLLGRRGFGVLENHLFLSGTEDYRELRRQIQAAATANIAILPAGTDIVGPRADHVAFEGMGFPTLFYSCGLFDDYHRPGDTAEKVDYAKMGRSTEVIKETALLMANASGRFESKQEAQGDQEELQVLALCLGRLNENPEIWELAEADADSIQALSVQIQRLLEKKDYTRLDRARLIRKAAMALLPVIGRFEPEETHRLDRRVKPENREALALARKRLLLLEMMELSPMAAEAGRALMSQLPRSRARLLWPMSKISHKDALVSDLYLDFQSGNEDRCQLIFVIFGGEVSFRWPGLLLMPWAKMPDVQINVELISFHGTQQEIFDACLLMWKEKGKGSESYDHVMPAVLAYLTGEDERGDYDQCMTRRLEEDGWPDESTWLIQMIQSPNPRVAKAARSLGKEHLGSDWQLAVQGVLVDADTPAEIKWETIEALGKTGTRETLLALVGLLHDDRKRTVTLHSHPFDDPNHPILELIHRSREYSKLLPKRKPRKLKADPKPAPRTLGDLALKKLKSMTHRDFGKDAQAWKNWISNHWAI